jgi:acetyl coenzyme A synthetase (ADP forming)-like protein
MLNKFFNPKSIAVIGASRKKEKIGHAILESLKNSFSGKIYPINPNTSEVLGLKAYPSVLDVPDRIDLAIIAIPAENVEQVVKECKKKQISALIIISSGFSEIGEVEREKSLAKIIKTSKMRVIGPNCVGIYDPFNGIDTLFMPKERMKRPSRGGISFITQSGAVGTALLDVLAEEGAGISKFISIGNKIDVDEIELIQWLSKDPSTRVIAIYLESTGDGKKFMDVAKKCVKQKPIVCLKAGKTEKGEEAVRSHTGSLAGKYEIYSAAFKQVGIIEARTCEELLDFSKALATQPPISDENIAIVTDGGGFGILAADEAEKLGLKLPQLKASSIKALKEILPPYASLRNPIDLTGDANAERYKQVLDIVFKDKNISALCIIALLQITTLEEEIVNVLKECKVYGKPFVVCMMGSSYTKEKAEELEHMGIPVYSTPERAIKALNALRTYGKILERLKE